MFCSCVCIVFFAFASCHSQRIDPSRYVQISPVELVPGVAGGLPFVQRTDSLQVTVPDGLGPGFCYERGRKPPAIKTNTFLDMMKGLVRPAQGGGYVLLGCIADPPFLPSPDLPGNRGCYYCLQSVGKCDDNSTGVESVYAEDTKSFPGFRLVVANGIPNHCYNTNQSVSVQPCESYRAMLVLQNPLIPANPVDSDYAPQPFGPVGIAKSGAFFYNQIGANAACNVAAISDKNAVDSCDGHADSNCRYHYSKAPTCMPGFNACGLLGYMHDGIAIFGKCDLIHPGAEKVTVRSCWRLRSANLTGCLISDYVFQPQPGCNLDKANGYRFLENATSADGKVFFPKGYYAYFMTAEYPFIMPYYLGLPTNYGTREPLCSVNPYGSHYITSYIFYRQRYCGYTTK